MDVRPRHTRSPLKTSPSSPVRAFFRKAFIPAALLPAMGYPAFIAYGVAVSGKLDAQCARSGRGGVGLFCEWGPKLGEVLFGPERAVLGYALLMGGSSLLMLGFAVLAILGSSKKPPMAVR